MSLCVRLRDTYILSQGKLELAYNKNEITAIKSEREQILIEQKGQMDRNEDNCVSKHQCQHLSRFLDKYSRNVLPAQLKSIRRNTNEYNDRNKIKQHCLIKAK